MTKDSIIAKITKLLALANNNANEHERARAMETAHKLIAAHNIEQHELRKQSHRTIEIDRVETNIVSRRENWNVLFGVCKLYYTAFYTSGGKCTIYGTPENIETTIAVAEYLICSIDRESKQYPGGAPRNSFKRGAAAGVYENANRILDQEKNKNAVLAISTSLPVEQRSETGTQLMVIRNELTKANEDYAKEKLKLKTGRTTGRVRNDYSAYQAGKAYGSTLNLRRGITGA